MIEGLSLGFLGWLSPTQNSFLCVFVSFIDGLGNKETLATSAPSSTVANVNDAPTGSLIIVGTTAQDSVLTANTSSIADQDGLGDFSFQWYRGD